MSEELEIEYIEMGESEEDKPASSAEPGAVDEAPENLTPDKYLVWRMNRWRGEFAVFYRAVLGEFFATAMFVFMILSAVIHFSRSQDLHNTTHIINPVVGGVSTAFAACVVAYSFADISGAHFNPAVTFATVVTFKMSIVKGFCYMVSQCAGATFACLTIALIFPAHITDLKKSGGETCRGCISLSSFLFGSDSDFHLCLCCLCSCIRYNREKKIICRSEGGRQEAYRV